MQVSWVFLAVSCIHVGWFLIQVFVGLFEGFVEFLVVVLPRFCPAVLSLFGLILQVFCLWFCRVSQGFIVVVFSYSLVPSLSCFTMSE